MASSPERPTVTILETLPFFEGLSPQLLQQLASRMQRRRFAAGEVVFRAGEPASEFYVVESGLFRVFAPTHQGERPVSEVAPGQWFGELSLITGEPRSATVSAVVDSVLLSLPRDDFRGLMQRVPTLAALSRDLSRRLRANTIRRPRPTRPRSIVAVSAASSANEARLILNLATALAEVSLSPTAVVDCVSTHPLSSVGGNNDDLRLSILPDLVVRLASLRDLYLPVLVRMELNDPRMAEVLVEADEIWLLDAGGDDALRALGQRDLSRKVREIRCGLTEEVISQDVAAFTVDVLLKAPLTRVAPYSSSARALRRFARSVLGQRLGLALSAGGARVLAQVGALHAFERTGLHFDVVAGTSVGGLVGAFVALEENSQRITDRFLHLSAQFEDMFVDFASSDLSLLRGEKKRAVLREMFQDAGFKNLRLPFWTVVADLASGREITLCDGPLWEVLDAATAIPVVYPPVVIGDYALVDGWVVNPLPADILCREGADIVVALDTSGVGSRAPIEQFAPAPVSRLKQLGQRLTGSDMMRILRVALRAMEVGAYERTTANLSLADACVQPDLAEFAPEDFRAASAIIERGQQAAEQALPSITEAIRFAASQVRTAD